MADDIYTPDNWDLDFYKPEDLMGNRPDNQWVNRNAATLLNTWGKSFYEETGKRVSVNLPHQFNADVEGTEGKRRGTRSPADRPPGGALNSRHFHGDAFDLQIQDLTDDEKRRAYQSLRKAGFKGFGFYTPEQGGHLHVDTGKPRSWGNRPSWAVDPVEVPDSIRSSIMESAQRNGIDPKWLAGTAYSESSYRENLQSKSSSAYGTWQMLRGTWEDLSKRYGSKFPEIQEWDRSNTRHQALLMGAYFRDQRDKLKNETGSDPTLGDIYGTHHFGATGYRRIKADLALDPNAPAFTSASEAAVAANHNVFYHKDGRPKTRAELVGWLSERTAHAPGWDDGDLQASAKQKEDIAKVQEFMAAREATKKIPANIVGKLDQTLPGVKDAEKLPIKSATGFTPEQVEVMAKTGVTPGIAKLATERIEAQQNLIKRSQQLAYENLAPQVVSPGNKGYTVADVGFLNPKTPAEGYAETLARIKAGTDPVSLQEGIHAAISNNWALANLWRGYENMAPDPNFSPGTAYFQDVMKNYGLDPKVYGDLIQRAGSDAQVIKMAEWAQEHRDRSEKLASMGVPGTLLNIAAALTDPVDWAVILGTEGAAGAYLASKGIQLTKPAMRLYGGAIGAMSNAAAEGVHVAMGDPNRDWHDVFVGAALGAGIGALVGPSTLGHLGVGIGSHELAETSARIVDSLSAARRAREADLQAGRAGDAGAARNIAADESFINHKSIELLNDADVPEGALGPVRFDSAGITSTSVNPGVRATTLVRDAVGKKGHEVNAISVSEDAARMQTRWLTQYNQVERTAWRQYLDEQNISAWNASAQIDAYGRFNDEVADYIRNVKGRGAEMEATVSAAVKKLGDETSRLYGEILENLKNPNYQRGMAAYDPVKGFDQVMSNPNYVMRVFDHSKLQKIASGEIEALIYKAFTDARGKEVDQAFARKLAKGFATAIKRRAHHLDDGLDKLFLGVDTDTIRGYLRHSDMSAEEIDEAIRILSRKADPDAGKTTIAKHRVLMNEDAAIERADGSVLRFQDLLVNDNKTLFEAYARIASNRTALARLKIANPLYKRQVEDGVTDAQEFILNGIKSEEDWQKWRRALAESMAEDVKAGRMTDARMKKELDNLQFQYDYLAGNLQYDFQGADAIRMIRKLNYIRLMNQVGFSQLAEVFSGINKAGFRAVFEHMPAIRRVMKDGRWALRNGLDDELEYFVGIGGHELRGDTFMARMDAEAGVKMRAREKGTAFDKAESLVDMASNKVSKYSGMNAITAATQRWAAKSIAQKFMHLAQNPNAESRRLMSSLGIDAEKKVKYAYTPRSDSAMAEANDILKRYNPNARLSYGATRHMDAKAEAKSAIEAAQIEDAVKQMTPNDAARFQRLRKQISPDTPGEVVEGEATMLDRIIKMIKENATTENGMFFDKKINLFNFEDWADQEARDALQAALFRGARQIVQEGDPGMGRKWMSHPAAQLVTQFRKFTMDAYSNHFLHTLHYGFGQSAGKYDMNAMAGATFMVAFQSMIGGLVYMLQEHARSIGRDDAKEHLEKRMTWDNVAKAGFTKTGFSSLIPTVIDSTFGSGVAAAMGAPAHPMFDYRTTANPQDIIFGNPTFAALNDAQATLTTFGRLIGEGRGMSQVETKKALGLFLPNALPILWGLNFTMGKHGLNLDPFPPPAQR